MEQICPIPKIFGIRTVSKILFSQGFSGHQVVYETKKGIKLQFNAALTIKYEGGKNLKPYTGACSIIPKGKISLAQGRAEGPLEDRWVATFWKG